MQVHGSRVLVTGASGGLGRHLACAFHRAGGELIVTGRRRQTLEDVAADLGAEIVVADLSSQAGVDHLAASCGVVDILVANAAIPASGRLSDYSATEVDRAIDVNLRSVIQLTRHLIGPMQTRGVGHVVLIGSMSGMAALPRTSLYTATKFALRGFAHGLRQDLVDQGVGVSLVQPGLIQRVGMWADADVSTGRTGVEPGAVASAAVAAVLNGEPEKCVASLPLRVWCMLYGVSPPIAERWWRARHPSALDELEALAAAQAHLR